ncbi:MAG: prepilin-type N-terminal cleavage/methylation domain-containing protein [Oscillospiraceae bacterium]|nr:prepilin-type N-terminal cleavage/methylation domain-containing protein [Oscillospiraceae bacterium]
MNENRRNGRKALKGFTLVEIIVVLVILAILAAAMIPALTGYIDKAKERTVIAEARNVLTAAQTLASEEYGLHGMKKDGATTGLDAAWVTSHKADIFELCDLGRDNTATIADVTLNKAKITGFKYTTDDGTYTVTYNGTEFTVKDNTKTSTTPAPTTSPT